MENRRAVVDHGLPQPGLLRILRFPHPYAVIERHGHTEPAERLRASTRLHPAPAQDRPGVIDDLPEKIEIKQYCQLTTERGVAVSGRRRRHDGRSKTPRRDRAARQRALAAMAQAQQVCNRPRPAAAHDRSPVGRRSGKVIRLEKSWKKSWPRATGAVFLPSSPGSPSCWCTWPLRPCRRASRLPARWHPEAA